MSRSNELGESLEQTIDRARHVGALLMYQLAEGEIITVAINGNSSDEISIEESRLVTAKALGKRNNAIEVIEDTAQFESWQNKIVSLGSYAFGIGRLEFDSPGLLRGYIGKNCGVVVDLSGEDFRGEAPPLTLMAEYESLWIEDHLIF